MRKRNRATVNVSMYMRKRQHIKANVFRVRFDNVAACVSGVWRPICTDMRQYAQICGDIRRYAPICADMRRYAPICADMRRYAQICADVRRYAPIYADMRRYAQICTDKRFLRFPRGPTRATFSTPKSDAH